MDRPLPDICNVVSPDSLRYAEYAVPVTGQNPAGGAYTNVFNNHQEEPRLWLSTNVSF